MAGVRWGCVRGDAGLIQASRRTHVLPDGKEIDLGRVGDVKSVNPDPLRLLQDNGFVPVLAPLGAGPHSELLNINADLVAGEVAAALHAVKMIFLSDVPAIRGRDGRPLRRVTVAELNVLTQEGIIEGGMLPKVEACARALKGGVGQVYIVDGRLPNALLLKLFTPHRSRHGGRALGEGDARDRPGTLRDTAVDPMSGASLGQYSAFLVIVVLLVRPVGAYLARVFSGERTWLDPLLCVPLERAVYRLAGVDAAAEMDWKHYAGCFVGFGLAGTLLVYAVLRVQPFLHLFDPAYRPGPLATDLAMNTAISFATTTTWQAYAGETTMSYLSQIVGLTLPELPGGSGRPRRGYRVHPGPVPAAYKSAREFLGRRDPRDPLGAAAPRGAERPGSRSGRASP